jgi:hypothetical protein
MLFFKKRRGVEERGGERKKKKKKIKKYVTDQKSNKHTGERGMPGGTNHR